MSKLRKLIREEIDRQRKSKLIKLIAYELWPAIEKITPTDARDVIAFVKKEFAGNFEDAYDELKRSNDSIKTYRGYGFN